MFLLGIGCGVEKSKKYFIISSVKSEHSLSDISEIAQLLKGRI